MNRSAVAKTAHTIQAEGKGSFVSIMEKRR